MILRISLREHGLGRSIIRNLAFLVFPNNSEKLILGKPQLDDLGYTSTKFGIELQAHGIRFPAVLPAEYTGDI